MAVYREPEKCPKCGEEYNGIYSDNEGFVGDTFIMWDVSGHKCNQQPPAASEVQQGGNHFLLGKQIRHRYVDWEEGSFTPWYTCKESDLKKVLEDHSVDIVQFKP